jgi:dTDP-glucose 4,6-dehydratase
LLEAGCEVVCVDTLITAAEDGVATLKAVPGFSFVRHDVSQRLEIDGEVAYVLHFASPASPEDYHRA